MSKMDLPGMHAHARTHMHARTHTYTHTHTHARSHARRHTHTHRLPMAFSIYMKTRLFTEISNPRTSSSPRLIKRK
jgi:hypothetical protein